MGGEQWARFAFDNGTPIVPLDHVCHPRQIIARGYQGTRPLAKRVSISQWPIGTHYYAQLDGETVIDECGREKWNTHKAAWEAAERQAALSSVPGGLNTSSAPGVSGAAEKSAPPISRSVVREGEDSLNTESHQKQ